MFCPEKMRLNKFVKVSCPKPRDLYIRIGPRNPLSNGSNDGSTYSETVDFNRSCLDSLAIVANEERTRLYEDYRKEMASKSQQQQEQKEEVNE